MTSNDRPVPPDFGRCQTDRPSTWPAMPSLMTLGPVKYERCRNRPVWLATDGKGEMTVCEECRVVMVGVMPEIGVRPLTGVEMITAERERQVTEEGHSDAHDDEHDRGEIIAAAIAYAAVAERQVCGGESMPDVEVSWPLERSSWKPKGQPIRNLVRAGALIAAEIDRLRRASLR